MRYRLKSRIRRKLVFTFMFVIALSLSAVLLIDWRVRPMIGVYGSNQAATAATRAINAAAETVLSQIDIGYNNLAEVVRDGDGKIVSINTDTTSINIIKAAVSKAVLKELDNQKFQYVKIPIGSLAGGLLTGRGPEITIKVPMNSTVETEIENRFEGAGINQTKHQILISVKATIFTVMQGESAANEITTSFTVAENILVGEVPGWYINSGSQN